MEGQDAGLAGGIHWAVVDEVNFVPAMEATAATVVVGMLTQAHMTKVLCHSNISRIVRLFMMSNLNVLFLQKEVALSSCAKHHCNYFIN